MLIKAAAAGQGVALVRDIYARDEVAAGRLVRVLARPHRPSCPITSCSEARQHEWKIAAFRDWLASEIGGDDDGDGPRDLLA